MHGPRVTDFFAFRKLKMGTWQVWTRRDSKSKLFKKSFNRKSQANILKNSGCTVCRGLSAQLGGKGYVTFQFWARECRTLCAWARSTRLFGLRKPKRGTRPVWGRSGSNSTLFQMKLYRQVAGQEFQEFWVYCLSWSVCPA